MMFLRRDEAQTLLRSQFPEILNYRYPCDFTESKDTCDITVDIKYTPAHVEGFHRMGQQPYHKWIGGSLRTFSNNLVITNHHKDDYPIGTYHLNRVSCTCPSFLQKMQNQIQSLFGKKITQANCRAHDTKEFDVYLRSNFRLFKKT